MAITHQPALANVSSNISTYVVNVCTNKHTYLQDLTPTLAGVFAYYFTTAKVHKD